MDRIMVQVRFKKVLWTCPSCSQEDEEDMNVAGGNTYEHDCSSCFAHFNQSNNNMKTCSGLVTMLKSEYDAKDEAEIAIEKQSVFDKTVYAWKNPPEYVEPTKEDLEQQRARLLVEVNDLDVKITEKDK